MVNVVFIDDHRNAAHGFDAVEVLLLQRCRLVLASLALDAKELAVVAPNDVGHPTAAVPASDGVEVIGAEFLEDGHDFLLDFDFGCISHGTTP